MLLFQLLSLSFLIFSDATDGLDKGQFSAKSHCVLCGGRFLCGAVEETLSIEVFNEKQNASVAGFCTSKNYSYQKQNINRIPWVSDELKSFQRLKKVIRDVALLKSSSKYTNDRIKSITDEKIDIRVQYRMKKGLPYDEIRQVLSKTELAKLKAENKIIPVFSLESFKSQVVASKKAYKIYLEHLITAPTKDFDLMNNGYAHIISRARRAPASYLLPKKDIKEKKPHKFYHDTSINSFIKKISRYPTEFCEKMTYQEMMATNRASLKKISVKYGGQSNIEQNYYYKQLVSEFSDLEKQNISDCKKGLQTFLNSHLITLPNPEIVQIVNKVNQESNSRLPSSIGKDRPIHCEFNINNYQEECD